VYNGSQFIHAGTNQSIAAGGVKKLTLSGIPAGNYSIRLEVAGTSVSNKTYNFQSCETTVQTDDIVWDAAPSVCDQNNKRSIGVNVTNNGSQTKSYKIAVYNGNTFIHSSSNQSITASNSKKLTLSGIPAGNYSVRLEVAGTSVSNKTFNFQSCTNSVTTLQPFFTDMGSSFVINLSDYFTGVCSYQLKKLSPGITYNLSGNTISITPTTSFLGKSNLEVIANCGAEQIVEIITIHTQMPSTLVNNCNTKIVNIGSVNFDPVMPQYGNQLCHQAFSWADPMVLTESYIAAMSEASGNYIYFNLVEWVYANEFPVQNDGTQFTPASYDAHLKLPTGRDVTTRIDYPKVLQQYGMTSMVKQKQVDEVWIWGGAFFGEWEASMAGPGAFFINGGVYPTVDSDRPFAFLGFNYERALAEMMHSNGHRAENHMKRSYNNKWNMRNPTTNWDKFTSNKALSTGIDVYGVGDIHFAANGRDDYDFVNAEFVTSNALDYANYPNFTGTNTQVNSNNWGSTHEGYMKFWFNLLPKATGINADGRMNNWWKYIYDFSSYNSSGASINTEFQLTGSIPNKTLSVNFGEVLLFDLEDYISDNDVAVPQIRVSTLNNGVNLHQEGTKIYANSVNGFTGLVSCRIYVCDGQYVGNYIFTITVGNGGNKLNSTDQLEAINYPNPFNGTTTIEYTLLQKSKVSIKIYNSLGKQIEVLTNNTAQQKGIHQVSFDGTKYPSGIYYYGIQNNDQFSMYKMTLIKE